MIGSILKKWHELSLKENPERVQNAEFASSPYSRLNDLELVGVNL